MTAIEEIFLGQFWLYLNTWTPHGASMSVPEPAPALPAVESKPQVAALILKNLYAHPLRSSDLVAAVASKSSMSEPAILNCVAELVTKGYLNRVEHSRKNVHYALTPMAETVVMEEYRKHHDLILEALTRSPEPLSTSIEAVALSAADMLGETNPKIRKFIRGRIKELVKNEIDAYSELLKIDS